MFPTWPQNWHHDWGGWSLVLICAPLDSIQMVNLYLLKLVRPRGMTGWCSFTPIKLRSHNAHPYGSPEGYSKPVPLKEIFVPLKVVMRLHWMPCWLYRDSHTERGGFIRLMRSSRPGRWDKVPETYFVSVAVNSKWRSKGTWWCSE